MKEINQTTAYTPARFIQELLNKTESPNNKHGIKWRSDYIKLKAKYPEDSPENLEELSLFKQIVQLVEGRLLYVELPHQGKDQELTEYINILIEHLATPKPTPQQVRKLLTTEARMFLDTPDDALLVIDKDELTVVYLLQILKVEKVLRHYDEGILSMLVPQMEAALGLRLELPVRVSYSSFFGTMIMGHKIKTTSGGNVHSVSLGIHAKSEYLHKLLSGQEPSLDEFLERCMMIVHELAHAFNAEIFEDTEEKNVKEIEEELQSLYLAFSEGFSLLAERIFILKLLNIFEAAPKELTDRLKQALYMTQEDERYLRKDLQKKAHMFNKLAPYAFGYQIMRKLRPLGMEDLIFKLKRLSFERLTKIPLTDPEVNKVLEDPISWINANMQ